MFVMLKFILCALLALSAIVAAAQAVVEGVANIGGSTDTVHFRPRL